MRPEDLGAYYESILDKEVRKEGGIYYTPQYIVDYIVEHTVGKCLDGKTPAEITKIKIVDPACGAGIFLLGAYQYSNRWDKNYWILYGQNLAAPRDPAIFSAAEKIVVRQTGDSLIATLIGKHIICRKNLHKLVYQLYGLTDKEIAVVENLNRSEQ